MPPNILYNLLAPTGATSPPVIFEPPSQLTGGRHEVWIALGGSEDWGGAEIWASVTGDSYDKIGHIVHGASVGALGNELVVGADPDTTSTLAVGLQASQGVLHPGSQTDADKFVTLCWVDGELIAYTTARLIAPYSYVCDGYLRRGVFDTPIAAHPAGSLFARLNQAVFRFEYPPHLAGETVWLKFAAHNTFGNMAQTLDQVEAHSFTLAA